MSGTDAGQQHGSQAGIADSVRGKEGTGGAHTPGPWHVGWVEHDGRERHYIVLDNPITVDSEGRIANVSRRTEAAANARLIAAAPDLLVAAKAAAQFILNGVELGYIRLPDPDSGDSALMTRGLIVAAIAKAEGR